MATDTNPYTESFYAGNAVNSRRSAGPILQVVGELYAPKSAVDFGCGTGVWLEAAAELGCRTLRGYDGPWATPAKYATADIDFVPVDLETVDALENDRRFDLAICVEMASHLHESRADFLVNSLCDQSDVVLFGAPIRAQGGVRSYNEQPQSYWIEKFRARGYEPYDVIRPAVWDHPDVQWWFAQNTLLYVAEGSSLIEAERLRRIQRPLWDVVHPAHYRQRLTTLRRQVTDLTLERESLEEALDKSRRRVAELERAQDEAAGRGPTAHAQPVGSRPETSPVPRSARVRKTIPQWFGRGRPNLGSGDGNNRLVPSPVFIYSSERSGSTLLRMILDNHSQVCAPHEMHLRMLEARFPNWYVEDAWRKLGVRQDDLRFLMWDRLLHLQLVRTGKTVVVDKTPANTMLWQSIKRSWPEAKYIFLKRHPLHIAQSMRAATPDVAMSAHIEKVNQHVNAWGQARAILPGQTVSYEELTSEPNRVIRELCAQLGISWEPSMLNYGEAPHTGDFRRGLGDWHGKIKSGVIQPAAPLPDPSEVPEELQQACRILGYT